MAKPVVETVCGHEIVVLPEVFNPVIFRTGQFFAEFLHAELTKNSGRRQLRILDLGTGSGVLGVICASLGHKVTATDLNPIAVHCAAMNAERNDLDELLEVRHGDLFESVVDQKFDLILWNPPFFSGEPQSRFDLSWRSTDAIERFASKVALHTESGGRVLIVWSSHSSEKTLSKRFSDSGSTLKLLKQSDFGVERLSIYEIQCQRPSSNRAPEINAS